MDNVSTKFLVCKGSYSVKSLKNVFKRGYVSNDSFILISFIFSTGFLGVSNNVHFIFPILYKL